MADFSPASSALAVTPSDTVNFPGGACRGLYVGVTGNVAVVDTTGVVVTYTAVAAGIVHPIRATRINATNTTATSILALY